MNCQNEFGEKQNMKENIDMTYSFLWDSEPTDEQLLCLMKEVADDVRESNEKIAQIILENIKKESEKARSEIRVNNDKH